MQVSTSLRGRVPAQGVIGDIVAAQQKLPARSAAAKLFGVSPLTSSTRGLYRAALGELAVGEMLDQLGPRWDVLHAVPVGVGQIDHLVIGPPGVFAITTENYPGQEAKVVGDTMTIAGKPVDDILATRQLAEAAAERLSAVAGRPVRVEPIIVVIDSGRLVLREQPTGVTVIAAKQLLRLLTRLDRSLAGSEVAYVSDVAERDTTWETTPTRPEDVLQLAAQFAVLREQVRDATQSRVFWGVVAFAIICAASWIGTVVIVEQLLGR
jgi:Nuclease-related domain